MEREKSIGIDVSKAKLDVYCTGDGEEKSFENSTRGIRELKKFCSKHCPEIIAVESTGKYHREVSRTLSESGFSVLVAQPKRVRDFAKGLGFLAKTDSIDARCIALYGQKSELPPVEPVSKEQELLKDMVSRRQQLVEDLAREKTRLSSTPKQLQASLKRVIGFLQKEIKKTNSLIESQLEKCDGAQHKCLILCSAKGVGKIVAATLLACLPEIGTLSKRQVASLCGLAPFNHDSGGFQGKRSIFGGRATVRSALYMAALSAIRFDAAFALIYQKLLKKGKPKKIALTAIMRKLIVKLNAMVKNNTLCRFANA